MLLINDPKEILDPRQEQDIETQEVSNENDDALEQERETDAEDDEKTDYEQDDE